MRHPEQHENEIFVTNVFVEANYESIGWITKRKGKIAYSLDNEPLSIGYPVFAHREEIELAFKKAKDSTAKKVFKRMLEQ